MDDQYKNNVFNWLNKADVGTYVINKWMRIFKNKEWLIRAVKEFIDNGNWIEKGFVIELIKDPETVFLDDYSAIKKFELI